MRPIIVGSGMGGLCIGLILKKNGMEPIIFEMGRIGGSFASYNVDGYKIDTGLHMLTRGSTGELPVLMKKYISEDVFKKNFTEQGNYIFCLDNKEAPLPSNLPSLLKFKLLSFNDRIRFVRMLLSFLRKGREGTKDIKENTYDCVKKYIKSNDALYFFNALSWMCNGCSIKEGSYSRFVDMFIRDKVLTMDYVLKHMSPKSKASEQDWYPLGGLSTIPELFINEGLEVKQGTVEKIIVKDNKVSGVKVNGKIYPADLVVYDGKIKDLYGMIEGGKLEIKKPAYDEYRALTIWLGFNKKIANWNRNSKVNVMKSLDAPHWGLFVTDFDSSLAPEGHQLFGISTILHKDKDILVKEMKQTIEKFIPGYEKYVDMEHIQVCRAEKTLQKAGNCIWDLPEQKTNIKGLFVVGTDTKGWGNGGTLCADSAFRCWNCMQEK